jgi:hypothetical protein
MVAQVNMEKLVKYSLITMTAVVVAMLVIMYVGYTVFGPSIFETRYLTVIEDQARALGITVGHPIELGMEGEYIGFGLAGVVAGFVIGYLIPSVFNGKQEIS